MSIVVYSDPFVPAELIAASGLHPVRLPPRRVSGGGCSCFGEGFCPFARGFLASAVESEAGGVIFTTACDQMRRSAELFAARDPRPCFLLNIPHTWQGRGAFGLYVSELERLTGFLCEVGGHGPGDSELAASMVRYEGARGSLLDSRHRLTARQFHEAILALPQCDLTATGAMTEATHRNGIPVAVIGSPMMEGDGELFDALEGSGGRLALDATEDGEMTWPQPPPAHAARSALETLAAGYWNIPAPFRRPNDHLYAYLDRELAARSVRGIILRRYAWCDNWHAELGRLRQRYPLSVLDLDVTEPLSSHTVTRVDAFLEMLRER